MKTATLVLAAVTAVLMTSDMFHAGALRQWRDGNAAQGMHLMILAETINPYSADVHLDEIESLFEGYRSLRDPKFLREAVLIGGKISRDYPGSAQALSLKSLTLIMEAVHGAGRFPLNEAEAAVIANPLSVTEIERLMFLLSYHGFDYGRFKELGIARGRLTRRGLSMRCDLCGKHWLDHKRRM